MKKCNINAFIKAFCIVIVLFCGTEIFSAAETYQLSSSVSAVVSDDGKTLTISGQGTVGKVAEVVPNTNNIQYVIIEDGITEIGYGAFNNLADYTGKSKEKWDNLQSIVMADSVVKIGSYAFTTLPNLTDVVFSNNLQELGSAAFYNSGIKEIKLPASLQVIESQVFEDCKNLEKIVIPEGITRIESRAFYECINLKEVVLSNSIVEIGYETFAFCKSLEKISLPDTITTIDSRAFMSCSSLQEINIPKGITRIPTSMFENCTSLKNAVIPSHVTVIGDFAFSCCSSIEEIVVPEWVEMIETAAFYKCESLKTVIISNGIVDIPADAFGSCKVLTNVTIPPSVTTIHPNAFKGCKKLKTIKGEEGSFAEAYARDAGYNFDNGKPIEYTYIEFNKIMLVSSKVNVRNMPCEDGEKIGSLAKGKEIEVLGQCIETGWYKIKYGSEIGYVSQTYLVEKPEPKPTETESSEMESSESQSSESESTEPEESESVSTEPEESESVSTEPEESESETTEAEATESETKVPELSETETETLDTEPANGEGDKSEEPKLEMGYLVGAIAALLVVGVGIGFFVFRKVSR